MNFITILNTSETFKIGVVRNLFDIENIQYRILDEFTNNAAGIGEFGINGIRLQVMEENLLRAQNILKEADIG